MPEKKDSKRLNPMGEVKPAENVNLDFDQVFEEVAAIPSQGYPTQTQHQSEGERELIDGFVRLLDGVEELFVEEGDTKKTLDVYKKRLEAAELSIKDYGPRIAAVESDVGDHNTRIGQDELAITGYSARIDSLESIVEAYRLRIEHLEGRMTGLFEGLRTVLARYKRHETSHPEKDSE